jgi:hypothetical protein
VTVSLTAAAVEAGQAGVLRDVAAAIGEHALAVFPFHEGERGRFPEHFLWVVALDPFAAQRRQDLVGIGRKLVDYCVARARRRNECLLRIECKPHSSTGFWEKMGFRLIDPNAERRLAYRIIEKRHRLPKDPKQVQVHIAFYRQHDPKVQTMEPLQAFEPKAVQTTDGMVHLDRQVQFYPRVLFEEGDPIVRIEVNGRPLCFEKAKYKLAMRLGVGRCTNGFYVDRINLNAALPSQR